MKVAERTENPAEELHADPRWQLVQRIVASAVFVRSSRLSSFLLFVTQRALEGRTENLNEQEIGVKVFGRSQGYLQSDDNIVRANASRLRQRLEEYFAAEGQFETLRVTLPKGGYIPEFSPASMQPFVEAETVVKPVIETDPHTLAEFDSAQPSASKPTTIWKPLFFIAVALVAVLIALVAVLALRSRSRSALNGTEADLQKTPSSRLWAGIFDPRSPTLVVPADSSLVLYRSMTHRDVNLGEYINGEYRIKADDGSDDPTTAKGLARRRLTSIADLEFIAGVVPKIQQTDRKMLVRYARDLQTQDFRQSNIILLGARYANPWVSLMDGQRQFSLYFDETTRMVTIKDHSRQPDDLVKYHPGQPEDLAYAVISYVPNFTQGKHVLILEGTSIAGTEAAVNFLLESPELDTLLAKHMQADGSVPNFELVIESRDFSGTASNAKVIASRFF
jgi:hypothetical protein